MNNGQTTCSVLKTSTTTTQKDILIINVMRKKKRGQSGEKGREKERSKEGGRNEF